MDFSLSEEQELLQETVQAFVQKECPEGRVREVFDGESGQAPELWDGLVEMGVAGLVVPEAHGGAGLELLDLALVSEALGGGAVPVPFLGHSLAALALVLGGSEAQQERFLPGLAVGALRGTVALGEGDGGFQPEEWTARLAGGRVTGRKSYVPDGGLADLLVVGCEGGELALVSDASGVTREETPTLDRGRRLAQIELADAAAEPLAAGTGARVRDAGLVLLAADAFGAAHRLVRMSADYANTRQQFGQPIAQFQAVKHQLADMALAIDPTRGLCWWAAHAFDHLPEDATRAAAIAKAHVTDRAQDVARDAVEVHGGLGFTWECDVQIWFKRVMFDRLFLGGPELHRERAARLGGY